MITAETCAKYSDEVIATLLDAAAADLVLAERYDHNKHLLAPIRRTMAVLINEQKRRKKAAR